MTENSTASEKHASISISKPHFPSPHLTAWPVRDAQPSVPHSPRQRLRDVCRNLYVCGTRYAGGKDLSNSSAIPPPPCKSPASLDRRPILASENVPGEAGVISHDGKGAGDLFVCRGCESCESHTPLPPHPLLNSTSNPPQPPASLVTKDTLNSPSWRRLGTRHHS